MGFAFGNDENNQEGCRPKEQAEIAVYSGEKCVLVCDGIVSESSNSKVVITTATGRKYTVYNGVVIVKEKLKNL